MMDTPSPGQDALSPMDELEGALATAPLPVPVPPDAGVDGAAEEAALVRLSAQLAALTPPPPAKLPDPAPTHPPHSDALVLTDDAFADGIAAIFRDLAGSGLRNDDTADSESGAAADETTTLLLGELDRLWQRPAP